MERVTDDETMDHVVQVTMSSLDFMDFFVNKLSTPAKTCTDSKQRLLTAQDIIQNHDHNEEDKLILEV